MITTDLAKGNRAWSEAVRFLDGLDLGLQGSLGGELLAGHLGAG